MKEFAEKLLSVEKTIAAEKGPFLLFALWLREGAPDVWDLVVCAPWMAADEGQALRYILAQLNTVASPQELSRLSRVAIIDTNSPGLASIQSSIEVEHGLVSHSRRGLLRFSNEQGYVITCQRYGHRTESGKTAPMRARVAHARQ